MVRGRIIRSLLLALLVFCLACWFGSYWQEAWMAYAGRTTQTNLNVDCGTATFSVEQSEIFESGTWHWSHRPADSASFMREYKSTKYHFVGFVIDWPHWETPRRYHSAWILAVPLWFLSSVLALLAFLVWRRKGAKSKVGRFPIEAAETPANPH